jgi:hypothetical protein
MTKYAGANIFEKIGSLIPGYKGYTEKETRRDTDKLLRMEIAKQLDDMKTIFDKIILHEMKKNEHDLINSLDNIKRKLDLTANQIRYASCGYSGFFDVAQVDKTDLKRLYQFDLGIQGDVDQLSLRMRSLQESDAIIKDCSFVIDTLSALSDKIKDRDTLITEVR